jgi:mono/diheme cytochrome c family protein
MILGWVAVAGCVAARQSMSARPPLEAHLLPGAKTGEPVPLRFDPNAKVVIARVANLPPAPYSAAQAARGEQVFNQTCGACHTGERFIGQQFVDNWGDRRVGDFYALIRSTMPVDNPGGLKDQDYLDVTAYLLKVNHAPALPAPVSLSTDTTVLRGHRIAVHP